MLRYPLLVLLSAWASSGLAQSMDQAAPRVVEPDRLSAYWELDASSVVADVPNFGRNLNQPGCATVSFVVEPGGSTSTIKVQRVVPEGDLGKVARSMAGHMRFQPGSANIGRRRVFSWLMFPFNAPQDEAARSRLLQPCLIPKLKWDER